MFQLRVGQNRTREEVESRDCVTVEARQASGRNIGAQVVDSYCTVLCHEHVTVSAKVARPKSDAAVCEPIPTWLPDARVSLARSVARQSTESSWRKRRRLIMAEGYTVSLHFLALSTRAENSLWRLNVNCREV